MGVFILLIFVSCQNLRSQKISPCQLSAATTEKNGELNNSILSLRASIPDWYYYRAAVDSKKISFLNLYKNALVFKLIDSRVTDRLGDINLYAVNHFIMSSSEEFYFNEFSKHMPDIGLEVESNMDGSQVNRYQSMKGLWWYYMKLHSDENPERKTYVVLKNYNNKLFLMYIVNDVTEEQRVEEYIELLDIYDWNEKVNMKKDC